MQHRHAAFVLLFLAFLCAQGCGKSNPAVTGKVTYKENLLKSGKVHFIGLEGRSRSTLISPDGTYVINNPPLGEVKVAVESKVIAETPKEAPSIGKNPNFRPKLQATGSAIPPRYNKEATSGLSFTIKEGSQTIDLELND